MTALAENPTAIRPETPAPVTLKPRPVLVPLKFIELLTGVDEDAALRMVTIGQIEFAWNIAGKGAKARTIRILYHDALACAVERPCFAGSFDQALALFLPAPTQWRGVETILATTLRHRFLCGQDLIASHLVDREMKAAFRPAPRETPHVLYRSVIDFLKRRLIE